MRNGNKIRMTQMHQLLNEELAKNPEQIEWYNRNVEQARALFDSLSKRNDNTGFFEYRG